MTKKTSFCSTLKWHEHHNTFEIYEESMNSRSKLRENGNRCFNIPLIYNKVSAQQKSRSNL